MVVRDVQELYDLDSESEDEVQPQQRLRRRYIERNRTAAHERLVNDYFIPGAIFEGYNFRRRFRMYKPLYERIVDALSASSRFFQQHVNARGILGFTPLQKCTGALRQLAYNTHADALDESFRMSAKTARLSLQLAYNTHAEWTVFVKSWTHPHDEKRRKFKKAQERARKDVERAFGALKCVGLY